MHTCNLCSALVVVRKFILNCLLDAFSIRTQFIQEKRINLSARLSLSLLCERALARHSQPWLVSTEKYSVRIYRVIIGPCALCAFLLVAFGRSSVVVRSLDIFRLIVLRKLRKMACACIAHAQNIYRIEREIWGWNSVCLHATRLHSKRHFWQS